MLPLTIARTVNDAFASSAFLQNTTFRGFLFATITAFHFANHKTRPTPLRSVCQSLQFAIQRLQRQHLGCGVPLFARTCVPFAHETTRIKFCYGASHTTSLR